MLEATPVAVACTGINCCTEVQGSEQALALQALDLLAGSSGARGSPTSTKT